MHGGGEAERRRGRGAASGWGVVAVLAAATLVAMLSRGGTGDAGPQGAATGHPAPPPASGTRSTTGVVELGSSEGDLAATLRATTASLEQFWSDQMETVYGKPFALLAGGVQPKSATSAPWTCGGTRFTYADVRGNAFYCGTARDDYIAYDAASLMPRLNDEFGALTPAVVLAHEWGHAVQARAGVAAPSVVEELQADCFAGAWVAFAQHAGSDPVGVSDSALDSSVRAIPTLRDQPGTPGTNPQAHGLGFDRVNAYQTGYESGPAECARFPRGAAVVTELPFSTIAEARSGGNLDYAQTVQFTVASLDAFWSAALREQGSSTWVAPDAVPVTAGPLPDCEPDDGYDADAVASYCTSSNAVAWSDASLARLHASLGDLATASALSLAWARAAQSQTGAASTGATARLQQVCRTGAWVGAVAADRSSGVTLSPGDIDESLLAVLTPLSPDEAEEVRSTSFERVDSFRTGLLRGLARC